MLSIILKSMLMEKTRLILDLQREVFNREIGDPVILKVLRSSHTINITVKTEQMPDARMFK